MDCVRIEAGQPLEAAVAAGGTVCLGAGVHAGPLVLTKSVVLRGDAGAVIDAGGRDSVLRIEGDDLVIRVEAVTLRGGVAEAGGGLALTGWSEVVVVGCTLESNQARGRAGSSGGGGGAYASRGTLRFEGSTFRDNRAPIGSDLFVTGASEVTLTGGHLAGDIAGREGTKLALAGVAVAGALDVRGTTTRAPTVVVQGGSLGSVRNDPSLPASVEILP